MNNTTAEFLADRILSKNAFPKSSKPPVNDWLNSHGIHKNAIQPVDDNVVVFAATKGHFRLAYKKKFTQPEPAFNVKSAHIKATVWREGLLGEFAEKFAHKYLKVIEERSLLAAACDSPPDVVWVAVAPVRRERIGAWVSSETSDYVAEELVGSAYSGDDSRASAAKKIEYSMRSLINSIAEGVRDKGQSIKFDLTSNERFLDGIARAILFRLPVSFYKESGFIASLYRDFEMAVSAGKIFHDWWDVSMSSPGVITVTIKNEAPVAVLGDKPWKKARAIRFSYLKKE